jgi:hypothetical protein
VFFDFFSRQIFAKLISVLFLDLIIIESCLQILQYPFRAGYSAVISKMEVAYTKTQDAMEELSNRIDQYQFKERYNTMMNTVSEKIKVS